MPDLSGHAVRIYSYQLQGARRNGTKGVCTGCEWRFQTNEALSRGGRKLVADAHAAHTASLRATGDSQ